MKVVVVVPAYNEAQTIRDVVTLTRALDYPVLVVDDGSTDGTAREVNIAGAEVVRYAQNHGVGFSLDRGVLWAELEMDAEVIVTMDADGQHNPAYIPDLVAALDGADLVNGSRFLGTHTGMPWHRRLVLWFVYMVFWLTSGREITDPCCGMKAFRPSAFQIRSHRMAWAAELCWNHRKGRIVEVPIAVRYTPYSLKKGQRSTNIFRAGLELFQSLRRTT